MLEILRPPSNLVAGNFEASRAYHQIIIIARGGPVQPPFPFLGIHLFSIFRSFNSFVLSRLNFRTSPQLTTPVLHIPTSSWYPLSHHHTKNPAVSATSVPRLSKKKVPLSKAILYHDFSRTTTLGILQFGFLHSTSVQLSIEQLLNSQYCW